MQRPKPGNGASPIAALRAPALRALYLSKPIEFHPHVMRGMHCVPQRSCATRMNAT